MRRELVYIYLLNVPSFSSRYFNKINRTSRLGRLLALSLEILFHGHRTNKAQTRNIFLDNDINRNARSLYRSTDDGLFCVSFCLHQHQQISKVITIATLLLMSYYN